MATVCLAKDPKHRRKIAIKVLRPELAMAVGSERFLQEIMFTAELSHPNILPLIDSGEADGLLYYIMPYAEGGSLRARMNRERQMSLEDTVRVAREVADALDYAHQRGVIHRDVKPENILFEAGHAVVGDFGIAKAVSSEGSEGITATGLAIGTPHYMSPQQAAGERNLDGRSDIYSLACVVFEMVTGQPPFDGPNHESVIRQQINADPPRVTALRPGISKSASTAIHKALAKVPADRFRTATEFVTAMERQSEAAHEDDLTPPQDRVVVGPAQDEEATTKTNTGKGLISNLPFHYIPAIDPRVRDIMVRAGRWVGAALVAVAIIIGGTRITRSFLAGDAAVSAGELSIALVTDAAAPGLWAEGWDDSGLRVTRGSLDHLSSEQIAFRLGVKDLDLSVAFQLRDSVAIRRASAEILELLAAVELSQPVQVLYEELMRLWVAGVTRDSLALEQSRARAMLRQFVEPDLLDLGTWSEAGRLASARQNGDLLRRADYAAFARVARNLDIPHVASDMTAIPDIISGDAAEFDFPELERLFTAVIRELGG
jgi:hypothetical protein